MIINIANTITSALQAGQPLAIGALILLGMLVEVGIPDLAMIDLVLIFVGFSIFPTLGVLNPMLAILGGQLLGASIIFMLSKKFGDRFSNWLCRKSPKLENKLIDLEGTLDQHVIQALLFTRLGPGLITAASAASGLAGVSYRPFAVGVILSAVIADSARMFAGFLTSKGFKVLGAQPSTWLIVLAVLVILVLFWGSMYLVQRVRAKTHPPKPATHSAGFRRRSCPLPDNLTTKKSA